ncbi:histidine--tRNA ligase [Xylella fastidiosa subsp. fastidiosa]|uniref:Histidine--tRNA ligase n=2 Tax=Xylella fastidiosa TaxID=2371 RepID=SYH_XYLFT|nr:histidine--tRNA ligase [Xylella fastidiosa]B2I5Y4.1 RecName: Full=Histidine--tRNA ligase; AltName: Full=Histidyl-tRNA synthetase; Short=HisRS [Xylella fastidiosa M23]Q87C26.1 RecName: Full=Histidine--tRNA ligase; AltName: Full=Histidyl-tRNA synthetase; Short=HisRS [Xylella fastidiosa Temecula1]ADN62110.1 histidyl-tRNA synthetase [Xylella fastidiosa subsp. fastidiosa GB514]KAF0570534.1 histidyl-tRNA synthase [Xylella fastidiosa subsp. fastidiosa Mus-1]AAO29119.1 histidyl-tRNA synthetase [Xyl
MIKPRTPPGVLELLPREQIAFQRMLDVIRRNYERFGFLPVETPVFELSDVLLTKSGGETERQVYFVQSTGTLANAAESGATRLPELALRFDLTVPLARYVAEYEHVLAFPFRRYQIQRVYRGERAQRGRFREFYQCDIDVIGKQTLSIRYDAEVLAVIHAVFSELGIGDFQVQLNNRKVLRGFLESQGVRDGELQLAVLREVDKLDKRGVLDVRDTLIGQGFGIPAAQVENILTFVATRSTSHADALARLDALIQDSGPEAHDMLRQGVAELREVLTLVNVLGVPEHAYRLNFSIARGLDYYTGTVYETALINHPQIGSICSGGRYENLANHYTQSKLPGVGISIGLTRLFWQLRDAGLIDGIAESSVQAMVVLMDEATLDDALDIARRLRIGGINTEVQMEAKKLSKQFQYASRAGIRFVVLAGDDERARGVVAVKDLTREQQFEIPREELASTLQVELEQAKVM